jgi:hypothetical protein
LSWDGPAAAAFNGDLPPADPLTVCGSNDQRFLAELLGGNPLDFKVPKRLADITAWPSQVVVSGTVVDSVLGTGDFPFDHTMGSDFNADVRLDEPFLGVGQEDAEVIENVHIELAAGQLPHTVTEPGPERRDWRDMTAAARRNLQDGFVARKGDRVLVMGSWIVDCGHTNFQTEIHPITFLAIARTEGDATVVHIFYNPWRETQLYNPDVTKAIDFDRPDRLDDPTSVPFPNFLIGSLVGATGSTEIASWAVLEANRVAPVTWRVCAPDPSGPVTVGAALITRPGVTVEVGQGDDGCAKVSTTFDGLVPPVPTPGVCVTPWEFLSEVATEEAGGESTEAGGAPAPIDLKAELGSFLPPALRSRLDADPVMNCYDPLAGPDLGRARPDTVDITADDAAVMPFFGTVVVRNG